VGAQPRVGGTGRPCSCGVGVQGSGARPHVGAQPRGDAALKLTLLRVWGGFIRDPFHLNPAPWGCVCSCRERGGYRGGRPPRGYRGLRGRRCGRLRRGRRELTLVRCLPCPRPSRGLCPPGTGCLGLRGAHAVLGSILVLGSISSGTVRSRSRRVSCSAGNKPSSKSSPSCSGTSQPGVKEELQHPDPPQPLSFKDGAQSKEQTAQVVGFYTLPPTPLPLPIPAPSRDPSLHGLSPTLCP